MAGPPLVLPGPTELLLVGVAAAALVGGKLLYDRAVAFRRDVQRERLKASIDRDELPDED